MAKWAAQLLQTVDTELRYRYSEDEDGEYDPANILYGMEVSLEHLDQVLEFFEGRAVVVPDFGEEDPGAEHPLYVKNKDEVWESGKYESK